MAGKRPACYPLIERRRDGNWHGGFALFGAGSRKRPQMKQHSVHGEVEVAMPTTRQHGEKITVAIDGELLECGVCCGPLTSELFQCTQGHISRSQRCTNEAPHGELECLMCRGEEPATRCRAMERVIAGVSTPCPFLQHGCTDMVPYTEKHSHEASCAHAPCLCPIAGCAGRAGVKSLRDHLMADHEEVTLTRVRPGRLTPVKLRACVENGGVACIIGSGAAEFLLAVGHGHGVPAGRTLSLLHLKDASQLVLDDGEEFMYRIEVVGESAVLSLSGQAEGVVRLRRPYQAREFLFVPDAMWGSCSGEVSVLIELKRSEDSV